MLAREAPVSAVSLAAKNAEMRRQNTTLERPSQSMHLQPFSHASDLLRELFLEEVTYRSGLDVVGDDGAPDRLQQNERQLAALDLLVLRHQAQERVGIGKT